MTINFKIENEIPKLRFADVDCPNCSKSFDAMGYGTCEDGSRIVDYIDLKYGVFKCPHCNCEFTTRAEDVEYEDRKQ